MAQNPNKSSPRYHYIALVTLSLPVLVTARYRARSSLPILVTARYHLSPRYRPRYRSLPAKASLPSLVTPRYQLPLLPQGLPKLRVLDHGMQTDKLSPP